MKLSGILILLLSVVLAWPARAQFARESVLASGQVYKLKVSRAGLYRIDAGLLAELGLNPATTDPAQVRVFGNGGGMLPQPNHLPRQNGLAENPVLVHGGGDGNFGSGDYVLFYAEGADKLRFNHLSGQYRYEKHLYATENFYFLKVDGGNARVIETLPALPPAAQQLDYFEDVQHFEQELINYLDIYPGTAGTGRRWFGESFAVDGSVRFELNTANIASGRVIKVQAAVMANSPLSSHFTFALAGQQADSVAVPLVIKTDYGIKGRVAERTLNTPASGVTGAQTTLQVTYSRPSAASQAYLDYITAIVPRKLRLEGNQLLFGNAQSLDAPYTTWLLQEDSDELQVWEVTDPANARAVAFQQNGGQVTFTTASDTLKRFIAFKGANFERPEPAGAVPAQNLHGLSAPNLLVVTTEGLKPEAERLASFRRSFDELTVAVVTDTEIYNEFSSGKQDVTAIRDFARMLYLRDPDPVSGLRYLLLFGDASWDYKNISGNNPENLLPIYQSVESLHPIFSYSSDDYFGFFDKDEGAWQESPADSDHDMEIGIGRLPVNNLQQAASVVDKLVHYSSSPETLGRWRKQIAFVADDGDANTHQQQANTLAAMVEERAGNFNVERIFVDGYPQVTSTSTGKRISVAVREAIDRNIRNGVLVMNYSGHGAETGWASENILNTGQILKWDNLNNMPLMVTATCEFGRYDNPKLVSGAEHALLNPGGGAIGLLTTTRPVFSNTNFFLNRAFYAHLFEPVNGEMPRLGNIIKNTKNNSINGVLNRNFALLGDPSMQLAFPQEEIVLTSLNGRPVQESSLDTLGALSRVTFEGEVRHNGGLSSGFNGSMYITVFDKKKEVKTLGDDGPATVMRYNARETVLFRGRATVSGGKFSFSFMVPKDISYTLGEGRVSLYARHHTELRDASGFSEQLLVGGSQSNAATDNIPPEIELFMGDESFRNGGMVQPATRLLARISDQSGINITGNGLGHNVTAILNGDTDNPIVLNEYYITESDDFTTGSIDYPVSGLDIGKYTLTLGAWDNYNNFSEKSIVFQVTEEGKVLLQQIINSPNPFSERTTFSFKHNMAGRDLAAEVHIYNMTGQLVQTVKKEIRNAPADVNMLEWNGKDIKGARVPGGMYIYKLYIYSLSGGLGVSGNGRLLFQNP